MRVTCIADLHGFLPDPKSISGDLLLIAGDICPTFYGPIGFRESMAQLGWLNSTFRDWIDKVAKSRMVVAIWGNHDIIGEDAPSLAPKFPWVILQDDFMVYKKYKIYGSPWTPRFHDWAFNLDEDQLERKWKHIPDDTDIVLVHGPPYKIGDLARNGDFTGSPSLRKRMLELQPKLCVYGHIHEGRGIYDLGATKFVNASLRNAIHEAVYEPIEIDLDNRLPLV